MSDPEPDFAFRARLLPILSEKDRQLAMAVAGARLDNIGRKYGRFRTGVPLKGLDAAPGRT
ncbi:MULTISPECIES: hypothetical protein [unclassified Methylobacterium]|uniref:hypothetical protein n=1 Tax=unclassified Methylobacterium TaxID=2615210 RepID=UPI00226AD4D6|nr:MULTISPECIES: hypothetical protein [unclassified Methylobacterium]